VALQTITLPEGGVYTTTIEYVYDPLYRLATASYSACLAARPYIGYHSIYVREWAHSFFRGTRFIEKEIPKMPVDESVIRYLAGQFIAAEDQRNPVEPITSRYPDLTIEDAYRINAAIVEQKLKRGDKIVGMKIGATSEATQQQFGLSEPLHGYLLNSYCIANGASIPRMRLIHPRVECEVAFLLARDLAGPGVTADDVLGATKAVMASIEVVDTRTRDWQVGAREIVADNLIVAGYVVSERHVPVVGLDLAGLGVALKKNGKVVARAKGEDVLGNPVNPMVWLVNTLAEKGGKLKAGQVVISGSLTPLVPVDSGDTIEAEFERLGEVSIRFV
jgi:2-oxopent-4-enoate hydratase